MTKKHHKRSSKHHRRKKSKRAKIGHQADEAYEQTESPSKDLLKPPPVYPKHEELSDTGDGNSDANHIDKTPRKGFTELIRTLTKFESVSKPNGSSRSNPNEMMTGPEDPRQPKEQDDDDIKEYSDSENDRKLPAASTRPAPPLERSQSSESDNDPEPHEDDLPYEVPNVPHAAGITAPEPPEPQDSTNEVQLEEMLRVSSDVKLTHESCYLKAMKKVLNQYAQPQDKRNGYMAQMTYMYACAHTGTPGPFRAVGDEYHAAVRAMRVTMMPLTDRHYWEMTNIIARWEMILLQLFN